MRHKESHLESPSSQCNKNGKCIYSFPHPIREHTTIDKYKRVLYHRRNKESAWILSYILALLLLLKCHIHMDICFTANVVLYLYKYLFKGADTTRFEIVLGLNAFLC